MYTGTTVLGEFSELAIFPVSQLSNRAASCFFMKLCRKVTEKVNKDRYKASPIRETSHLSR